ncbi:MAG: hypothetical protein CM1200mP30_33780 [Pseudomonadota bacterium]|nr:MAG: hypothetical protein CM1200mP30_33780 [Pseudomonadota bacterium]
MPSVDGLGSAHQRPITDSLVKYSDSPRTLNVVHAFSLVFNVRIPKK